jgi:hypothetical protein
LFGGFNMPSKFHNLSDLLPTLARILLRGFSDRLCAYQCEWLERRLDCDDWREGQADWIELAEMVPLELRLPAAITKHLDALHTSDFADEDTEDDGLREPVHAVEILIARLELEFAARVDTRSTTGDGP